MKKRKITAREILADVKAGFDDSELMGKYNLSAQGLQSCFDKMIHAKLITKHELDARVPDQERTVELGLFVCPACGNISSQEITECSRCGYQLPDSVRKEMLQKRSGTTVVKDPKRKKSAKKAEQPTEPPQEPQEDSGEHETASTLFPGIAGTVRSCWILSLVVLTSYVIVLAGLVFIMWFFPPDGVITVTQSLVGVFVLQLPALAIVLTTFINLRALTESMKVFSQVAESIVQRND